MKKQMKKEDMFHDYKLICQMKAPIAYKARMLTELLAAQSNPWRVVGITHEALKTFQVNDFKRNSKMGINRAHIVSRDITNKVLLQNKYDSCDKWWKFHYENDKTIFATSSENSKHIFSKTYPVDENLGLFVSRGFAWVHGVKEKSFLEELYRENVTNLIKNPAKR